MPSSSISSRSRPTESLFRADELPFLSDEALKAYEEARISGLCHEGALEIARDLMDADEVAESPDPRPEL